MDLDDNDEDFLPPLSTNTFSIPNDPDLLGEYELYKPSLATRKLFSERNRATYAEAFIEHERVGTLANLCVRALAKRGTKHIVPLVKRDPLKLRVHYDSLDVNLPLNECYFVEDLRFWQRVVLAKSSDKSLQFKKLNDYDWRGHGVSMKFVELVESCPAEYWPEKEMAELGLQIREDVRAMHIKNLKSLEEYSFAQYVESESDIDITSELSEQEEISSDEPDTVDELEEVEEEEEPVPIIPVKIKPAINPTTFDSQRKGGSMVRFPEAPELFARFDLDSEQPQAPVIEGDGERLTASSMDFEFMREERRKARHARNAERQALRDMQAKKLADHERHRQRRLALRKQEVKDEEPVKKKKKDKPKKKVIKGAFNVEVEPEPDDGIDQIPDKRNKELMLRRLRHYDYPSEHCHHIDLSFVRYFDNLVSFTLEFLGPEMGRDYHKRHMNFSYADMTRLSKGLKSLKQLKIFRLRNSRMNCMKLQILTRTLKSIESLEVVDFGYDQLTDDCGPSLGMLFDNNNGIKALELEYNSLSHNAMDALGLALSLYTQHSIEYLGLSHNPLGDEGLLTICKFILGSIHIHELHISGISASKSAVERAVNSLLRHHKPLLRLDMAAIPLDPVFGRDIIRALETNHKIMHFDCRGCDLDTDEEFEADIIVRRNNFELQNPYLGDTSKTEEDIQNYIYGLKHPIVEKIERDRERQLECINNRQVKSPSICSVEEAVEEEEYDIWTVLGIKTAVPERVEISPSSSEDSEKDMGPFVYNPNNFDLEELKEFIYTPGPENRYYYFQQNKEP